MTSAPAKTHTANDAVLLQDVEQACSRIAPTWPLDRFIAVNPYWGFADTDVRTASAVLGASSGLRMLMPRSHYLELWNNGELRREHLARAVAIRPTELTTEDLVHDMQACEAQPQPLQLITDLVELHRQRSDHRPWTELVLHQVSQHCASWFDQSQASWQRAETNGLYGSWRSAIAADRSLPFGRPMHELSQRIAAMPESPIDAIQTALNVLGITDELRPDYLHALLRSIGGWAAYCAHELWQARLAEGQDDQIVQLLAIRISWEALLLEDQLLQDELPTWRRALALHVLEVDRLQVSQEVDWLLQHATEIAFQQDLCSGLRAGTAAEEPETQPARPAAQAVFCIDVRSERIRRNLEQRTAGKVHTRGFAGFFGLPVAYRGIGSTESRPQLPGLLAPARTLEQRAPSQQQDRVAAARQERLAGKQRWSRFRSGAGSAFTFVESFGLRYAADLLRNSLGMPAKASSSDTAGLSQEERQALRPEWADAGGQVPLAERIESAGNVLHAMGLEQGFARLVLLAGHGSTSRNNPHAAGLDCGACGGQSGEVNARLLASLLNDPEVRDGLRARSIDVPADTQFVAGLHDTTTDEVRLFETDSLPASHREDLRQLSDWLQLAGDATRAERAPSLGLQEQRDDAKALLRTLQKRSTDWSQTRPEWGLANNAAFVVAPRSRTEHLNLDGRVFLHDYDWRTDDGFATLTLIMTAPMVVTNWINLQYYASTVDNERFGSGNKILHNVVGGSIGVFEGNGGDLRTGLSMQSLHDGERWQHQPLRLSVCIEAPTDAIDGVISEHEVVRNLVEHGWLHLIRIDGDQTWLRLPDGGWQETDHRSA